MATQHEIVLIDGGDDAEKIVSDANRSSDGGLGYRRPPEPRSQPVGPAPDTGSRKRDKEPDVQGAASDLASIISKALGGIAFIDTALRLRDAFNRIYEAVTKLDSAIRKQAEPMDADVLERTEILGSKVSGTTGRKGKGRKAAGTAAQDDFIEGEFTIKGPPVKERGLTVPVGPPVGGRPGLPGSGGGGLVTRGGGLSTQMASSGLMAAEGPAAAGVGGAAAAGEGLAAVAAAAGPLAIAIAGLTVAVAAGALAIKALFDTLSNEVKRLENVSPDVSVAASMSEVRRELADIRRSDQIGPELARFENVRSKFEDKASDLWTQVLKVLLNIFEVMEPGIEVITDGIGVLTAGMEVVNKNGEITIDILRRDWAELKKDLTEQGQATNRFGKAVENFLLRQEDKQEEMNDPFLDGFLGQFGNEGGRL